MAFHARSMIHTLLRNHGKIHRHVYLNKKGIRTLTWSKDPKIAKVIQIHVRQMKARLDRGCPVRRWSPLFRKLSNDYHSVRFHIQNVPGGVKVLETGLTQDAVRWVQAHALTVSRFVRKGFFEGRRCHNIKKK
jgi:hypothetical protein